MTNISTENERLTPVEIVPTRGLPYPTAPANRGGRPKGSRGNGKTTNEKITRIENNRRVAQAELLAQAEKSRADLAVQIADRKQKQAQAVIERYETQETKRAPQFQIDQRGTLYVLVALAAVTFIATAVLTADGTIGASAAARFAAPWMGIVLFGVFEVATLAFMLMYYVVGSRITLDGHPEKAGRWFFAMVASAAVTVGLSAYHVLDLYDYDTTSIDLWAGIIIRFIASLFFVLVSKGIAGVLFAKAVQLDLLTRAAEEAIV